MKPIVAIVGRPNVGKSSLVNAILNEERAIVSDIAGTTRDSIDSVLKYNNEEYFVYGRRNNGSFSISPLYDLKTYIQKTYKKLKLIDKRKYYISQEIKK